MNLFPINRTCLQIIKVKINTLSFNYDIIILSMKNCSLINFGRTGFRPIKVNLTEDITSTSFVVHYHNKQCLPKIFRCRSFVDVSSPMWAVKLVPYVWLVHENGHDLFLFAPICLCVLVDRRSSRLLRRAQLDSNWSVPGMDEWRIRDDLWIVVDESEIGRSRISKRKMGWWWE